MADEQILSRTDVQAELERLFSDADIFDLKPYTDSYPNAFAMSKLVGEPHQHSEAIELDLIQTGNILSWDCQTYLFKEHNVFGAYWFFVSWKKGSQDDDAEKFIDKILLVPRIDFRWEYSDGYPDPVNKLSCQNINLNNTHNRIVGWTFY